VLTNRLAEKVCIITGSGGAIGQATALLFAREGARIVGCGLRAAGAQETLDLVRSQGGEMVSRHPGCDLSQPAECAALVDLALQTYGRVDVLFNNAGNTKFGWVGELSKEDWDSAIRSELDVVFNMTTASWDALKQSGGTIVNTASTNAHIAYRVLGALVHTAAKGAIVAMTRQLAMEGREYGIRANSLSPGLVETPATKPLLALAAWGKPMLDKIMRGSAGKPEEIAAVALFLASDESSFVNAADIIVDGGTTAW
jgi:NAD(P)-dependent dehydrogenase (short-subunit alcohol dehydrogenase family)